MGPELSLLFLLLGGFLEVHIQRSYFFNSYLTFFQDHEVIEMFWEVLKSFSSDNQKKILKLVPLLLGLIFPSCDGYPFPVFEETILCKFS